MWHSKIGTVALARMFVMRSVRVKPVVAGGSIGIPKNVTEFPLTTPGKMFGRAALPS